MSNELDQRLRAHYEAQEPSPQTMERLLRTAESASATTTPVSRRWLRPLAVAAAALVCAIPAVLLLGGDGEPPERAVALEIAMNHRKALPMDVPCGHYSHIQRKLPNLDFSPVKPTGLAGSLQLAGARYCHIGPSIAVQCRLDGADGRRFTLYQFRARGDQDEIDAGTFDLDGVRVRVWRQGQLVLGLAHTR